MPSDFSFCWISIRRSANFLSTDCHSGSLWTRLSQFLIPACLSKLKLSSVVMVNEDAIDISAIVIWLPARNSPWRHLNKLVKLNRWFQRFWAIKIFLPWSNDRSRIEVWPQSYLFRPSKHLHSMRVWSLELEKMRSWRIGTGCPNPSWEENQLPLASRVQPGRILIWNIHLYSIANWNIYLLLTIEFIADKSHYCSWFPKN